MAGQADKSEWHDWVGDLFEPAFCATIDDLVAHEEEPDNKPKIKHISAHDPEAVRKVYEKVHMMTVLDEEMRAQRLKQAQTAKQKDKQTDKDVLAQTVDDIRSSIPGSLRSGTRSFRDEDMKDTSCIWDNAEISELRQAYKSLKQESIDSMVYVRQTIKRNEELEKLAAGQKQLIDAQKIKLTDAKKANKRLYINVTSLKDEVMYLTAKVGAMEDVIREMKRDEADMVRELHDNRVSTDKERMERGRIQLKLDSLKQEALAEKLAAEDKVRTQCKKAIHDLKEQVKVLTSELKQESDRRNITEKGLKHLRNHFSSLAVQDILPQNAVESDQLSHVQY